MNAARGTGPDPTYHKLDVRVDAVHRLHLRLCLQNGQCSVVDTILWATIDGRERPVVIGYTGGPDQPNRPYVHVDRAFGSDMALWIGATAFILPASAIDQVEVFLAGLTLDLEGRSL